MIHIEKLSVLEVIIIKIKEFMTLLLVIMFINMQGSCAIGEHPVFSSFQSNLGTYLSFFMIGGLSVGAYMGFIPMLYALPLMVGTISYTLFNLQPQNNTTQNNESSKDDVDWSEIQVGIPEEYMKYVVISGEPAEIDEDYIFNNTICAGRIHVLSAAQWENAWSRILQWKKSHNGKMPDSVTINDLDVGVKQISKKTYLDMEKRWKKSIEKNGYKPKNIGIEGDITNLKEPGPLQKRLINAVGNFNTFSEFYNNCKKREYQFYSGDLYDQQTAINRLKTNSGLNCVDITQLGHALAKEMGYEVKCQLIQFNQTKFEDQNIILHIYLSVKGREFKSWTSVDLSSSLHGDSVPLGKFWGNEGQNNKYDKKSVVCMNCFMPDNGRWYDKKKEFLGILRNNF